MADRFNEGGLAFIRTTNEQVYIIGLVKPDENDDQTIALVRRPVGTKNGIVHLEEQFDVRELETGEEKNEREVQARLAEYKAMLRLNELTKPEPTVEKPKFQVN